MAWQQVAHFGMGGSGQTTLNGKKVEQHIIWAGNIGSNTKVLADDNVSNITSWKTPDETESNSYEFAITMCVDLLHADGSAFTLAELEPYAQGTCKPGDTVCPEAHVVGSVTGTEFITSSFGDYPSRYFSAGLSVSHQGSYINRFTGLRLYLDATVHHMYQTSFDAYAAAYEGFGPDHPNVVAQAIYDAFDQNDPWLSVILSTWSITDADA